VESIIKAQNGDKDEMARLVENNQGLIWNIAKRFFGRGYDKEDIYQIGCMGFIKSIRRFDLSFDVKLSTYAVPYILGEIKKFLRDDGPVKVSRSLKELNIKIIELQKEYEKNGKELNILEISKILRVPKEEIIMAIESARSTESIENSAYEDNKTSKTLSIADTLSTNQDEATLITNKVAIQKMIENLDSREKEIILLRFYKDKTQSEVAKIIGISQVQVSRIEKKILLNMKSELVS
jgi:RNA polymerase sporulation-specific sigma factor